MRDRLRKRPGPQRGQLTGPNPTDRGKAGSKNHLIVDRRGLPLSVGISAANLHRTAREGIDSSQRLGRHRWVVERTISWLSGCRRLHRRYERKPEDLLAFTAIAATLIRHRELTN